MSFLVSYKPSAKKFIETLDYALAERLIKKIDELAHNPLPQGIISVKGERGVFRMRIGNYRALYQIDYSSNSVNIIKIGKREDIY